MNSYPATGAEAQAAIDAAAGPGYSIELAAPVNYGNLYFGHSRPCRVVFSGAATAKSLTWSGGQPLGNHIVKGAKLSGGSGVAITILDDVDGVLIEDTHIGPGYSIAYAIERASSQWPQPRNIRIHNLVATGMTNLGCIVGASDNVFEDNVEMNCRLCTGGNGAYHHDKQATRHRVRGMRIFGVNGVPACGIRAGGYVYEDCEVFGCNVNFAAGHNVQSIINLVSRNAKRLELQCGDYGPLYIDNAELTNDLPASQLDQGGPGHHNIDIGGSLCSRLEIRNSRASTVAPESGTCFASSSAPEYGAVVEMTMTQARAGSPIEWGANVAHRYVFPTAIA